MNRAMLGRMVLPGAGPLPAGTALLAVADDLAEAVAAVRAGADAVDFAAAPAGVITAFRARHPGVPVCAALPSAELVRDASLARATGALLLSRDAEAARRGGVAADRVLIEVQPALVPALIEAGLGGLVDADQCAELAARRPGAGLSPGAAAAGPSGAGPSGAGPAGAGPSGADPAGLAGIVAIAALSSWLGARVVRTRYPGPVRRALDMTASIRGTRPPARTVRGLA